MSLGIYAMKVYVLEMCWEKKRRFHQATMTDKQSGVQATGPSKVVRPS